ncbi:MAG: hypothetical protein AUK23_11640 [Deltaproteobacteria bacterium CG2_30_43_15]|nr:MAG: hypothetical protein AUK23_11640 [Deltaproteobacteria bacterium CG2_30_43_15]
MPKSYETDSMEPDYKKFCDDLLCRYSPVQIYDAITYIEMDRLHHHKVGLLNTAVQKLIDRIPKFENNQTNEMMEYAIREIGKVCQVETPLKIPDWYEACNQVFLEMDGENNALPIPFEMLSTMLCGGFYPQEMIVVAGRPGNGKTAFMLTLASHLARTHRVDFISAEMSRSQLTQRLYSMRARVDLRNIREKTCTGEEYARILKIVPEIQALNLVIDERSAPTFHQIREFMIIYPCDVLFIDYLQILSGHGKTLYERVTNLSGEVKALAKDLNIPVIIGCQLNRKTEEHAESIPRLSEMRESGAIEQDADVVLGLYHPEDPKESSKIIILKQRNGPAPAMVNVNFNRRFALFED